MLHDRTRCRARRAVLGAVLTAGALTALAAGSTASSVVGPDGLGDRLDRAFRSDLVGLDVRLDLDPATSRVDGRAELRLVLRPGQERALFHFNPRRDLGTDEERTWLTSVQLDGEPLDPQDDAEVRVVRPSRGAEPAFELQRDLAPGDEHTLVVTWSGKTAHLERYPGWFYPNFDDTEGPRRETETLWPTVSSPDELVRHRLTVRVRGSEEYELVGSGTVVEVADDAAQVWRLDSGEEISSSTMFFAAAPADDVTTSDVRASGVDVRIMSDQPRARVDRAVAITERAVPALVDDLGPFPVPSVHVLLTAWGSGMEYYGATRSGVGSLEHEYGHLYFGTTTVNRTWRDTWFDEAAVQYWQRRDRPPLPPDFREDIARGRSPAAPGFDTRAYGLGARVLGEIATALGGEDEMIDFLADLHDRRALEPFTTDDLIDDVLAATDDLDRGTLERWLYGRR